MRHVWICFILAGCMVGPDYQRPDAPAPVAFKEIAGWKISQPADTVDKGAWWSVYHDPELDRLERMVEVSNQNVKTFEAHYRNAIALVAEARDAPGRPQRVSSKVYRAESVLGLAYSKVRKRTVRWPEKRWTLPFIGLSFPLN
jgi:outer membrane protein TolC